MARSKRSLIPLRGSSEDWGPGKYQRNLERKEAYSQKMLEQAAQGPPDFEKLLGTGVGAPAARKKAAAKKKKAPSKAAKRTAKKKRSR